MIIALMAVGAAAAGIVLIKRTRPKKSMIPSRVAQKVVKVNPDSVSVDIVNGRTPIGSAALLRSNRQIYRDKKYLYMTTPDQLKSSGQAELKDDGELINLSFMRRGVPHSVACRTAGRMRLAPELTAELDTPVKVAYRLYPVGRVKKEEKRSFLRYLVAAAGNKDADTTPYITFDVFMRRTDKRVGKDAEPTVITDLRTADFKSRGRARFNVSTALNQFRAYMLIKSIDQRKVHIEKLPDPETLVGRIRTQLHHPAPGWTVELLDLEDDVSTDTFCVAQPVGGGRNAQRSGLNPADRVRVYFERGGKRYEMEAEVDRTDADHAALRPIGPLTEEAGLEVAIIGFSAGGALVQGSRKMLEFILNRPVKATEMSSEHPAHGDLLGRLKRHLVHFTFYPRLQFPSAAKRFHPRIPEKICLLGQIVRSQIVGRRGKNSIHHGIKFVYGAQYDAEAEGATAWKPIRDGQGDHHFNEIHAKLGRLSGFLESQSRDGAGASGPTQELCDDRLAIVNKDAMRAEPRRQRASS